MNIPSTANTLDPTTSIQKVRRNIFLLSLALLTSTKLVIDINNAQHSILISPFSFLPTEGIFSFLFSFTFIHHGHSVIALLIISLFLLICRSLFDYFSFEKFSSCYSNNARLCYTYACCLIDITSSEKNPNRIFNMLFISRETKHMYSHEAFYLKASNHMPTEQLKNICRGWSKYFENLSQGQDNTFSDLLNDTLTTLPPHINSIRKAAADEFYQTTLLTIQALFPSLIGAIAIGYSLYQLNMFL